MQATDVRARPPTLALALCLLAACLPARAADLVVRVANGGAAVGDAVVSLVPADGSPRGPASALPPTTAIDQRDLTFVPYVQVARPGGGAVFRNSDHTRHHVYSFSPAATFEMVLGPGERSDRIPLQEEGVVAVGCNIHDRMVTYLFVTDAPFAARTGADGRARFDALPDVAWTVRVWQPRLRDADGQLTERPFRPPAGDAVGTLRFTLALRPDRRHAHDRETLQY